MRVRLVAGNWKMHGTRESNRVLLGDILAGMARARDVEVAVCVPFPYLEAAAQQLAGTRLAWGAQNVNEHAQGAHTGEVSATMLAEFGCRYVIVGHSERRQHYAEDDARVAAKFSAARAHGMIPILCVGETLEQRESGKTEQTVVGQLDAVTAKAGAAALRDAVLAYEPVWAIGTGRTASPQEAQAVHALLRARLAASDAPAAQGVRILYGGSVKPANAAELFAMPDVDGGLIGGAALVAKDFLAIVAAAQAK